MMFERSYLVVRVDTKYLKSSGQAFVLAIILSQATLLRGRDRRTGVGRIQLAPVLFRPQPAQGLGRSAAGLHQRSLDRRNQQSARPVPQHD